MSELGRVGQVLRAPGLVLEAEQRCEPHDADRPSRRDLLHEREPVLFLEVEGLRDEEIQDRKSVV